MFGHFCLFINKTGFTSALLAFKALFLLYDWRCYCEAVSLQCWWVQAVMLVSAIKLVSNELGSCRRSYCGKTVCSAKRAPQRSHPEAHSPVKHFTQFTHHKLIFLQVGESYLKKIQNQLVSFIYSFAKQALDVPNQL